MSDVYCGQCGKYHASLTVCPNQNLQAVYTQKGTTTIDLDEMRAEITRLQAREAKLREALQEVANVETGAETLNAMLCAHAYKLYELKGHARAALGEGK